MNICCEFEEFPEVIVRHADCGPTLLDEYPGIRVLGPNIQAGCGSDPDPVTGRTRPGKPDGDAGPTRTGGTPNTYRYDIAGIEMHECFDY